MSESPSGRIPPGWYKDPTARHQVRWWDGTGWTQQIAPDRPPTAPLVPAAPVRREPKRRLTAAERKRQNRGWLLLCILVMALVIGVGLLDGPSEDDDSPAASGLDASAQLACRDFAGVARDANAGIITDAELREELKDINDRAQYSDSPGVASAAQSMLAAMTSGSGDLASSFRAMLAACT